MMSTTMTSAAYLMNVAATIQPPPLLLRGSRVSSSNSSKPLLGLMPLQLLRRNYRNTEHIVSQPRHDEEHKKGRSPEGPRPDAGADSGGEFTFPSSASGRHSPALPHLVGFPHQKSIEKAAGLSLNGSPAALVNLTIQDRQSAPAARPQGGRRWRCEQGSPESPRSTT